MTKIKRDTSRKKNSILDAAQQAFMEYGYENTSMDQISELAEASKRTVYNHFPSKDDLFQAVLERFFKEASDLKNIPYDNNQSLSSQLEKFVDAKIIVSKNKEWLGLMRVAMSVFILNPQVAEEMMDRIHKMDNYLGIWLEKAKNDNRLNFSQAEEVSEIFYAGVSGLFFWPVILGAKIPEKKVKSLKKTYIDNFLKVYQN
ncbi:MAG: TetR/AcrR family transcriptional regulator [Bdellovibrionota bacterium]|nr:TetR/AcrR family transcriptional regulator [Bdellovibrionota bacterium]